MHKLIIGIAAALCASATFAASPAATQAWVANALRTNNLAFAASIRASTSNNVATATGGEGDEQISVSVEECSDAALFVTNSVTAIANGTIFVWNGRGEYVNPVGTVVSTRTNLFWGAIGSYETNGVIRFDGAFDCRPVLIQASRSFAITNGMVAAFIPAPRRWYERIADALAAVVIPSALADTPEYKSWYQPADGWQKNLSSKLQVVVRSAKHPQPIPVDIPVAVDIDGNQYISKEDFDNAFSDMTININTVFDLCGAAFDGLVALEQSTMLNEAKIDALAKTVYLKTVQDLQSKDGKLTWKNGGGGAAKTTSGSYSPPEYSVVKDGGEFYLAKDGNPTTPAVVWSSGVPDGKTIGLADDKLQLYSWSEQPGQFNKLASAMTADTEDTSTRVLVKNGSTLQYWSLGKLDKGGSVKVDGASVVTNETGDGSASIAGFHKDAANGSVPFANGETLNWTGSPSAGAILGADDNSTPGWTSTSGDNRYYGTGDNGAGLGWHNLPNVTTNYVEADEVSLTATIDGDKKTLKIKEIDSSQIYGRSGDAWVPIPGAATNGAVVKVDGVSVDTNGTDNALQIAGWKDHSVGFIMHGDKNKVAHKTVLSDEELGGLEFDETDTDFGFSLENWWDGYDDTCAESLGGILTGEIVESANSHLVLTRKDDGTLHYMKIGSVTNNVSGGGCALKFIGTESSDGVVVGSGATTNNVTFASHDEDSNVKVWVTRDGDGGVRIEFGVYYK